MWIAGYQMHYATPVFEKAITLFYSGYAHLKMDRLFFGVVILGASGAMVDIAIAVSSSVGEIAKANPAVGRWRIIHSGCKVGRATLGTMTTTLLLAYAGCSMFLFLVFSANKTPFARMININFISAEVLRIFLGSIGMVLIAPITAVFAGFLNHRFYNGKNRESKGRYI